jgi:hypothetical protein
MNAFELNGFGSTPSPRSGLWFLRLTPPTCIVFLALAMYVFKSGSPHEFLLGLAAGLLAGLTVQAFAIKDIGLDNSPHPSDVQELRITR